MPRVPRTDDGWISTLPEYRRRGSDRAQKVHVPIENAVLAHHYWTGKIDGAEGGVVPLVLPALNMVLADIAQMDRDQNRETTLAELKERFPFGGITNEFDVTLEARPVKGQTMGMHVGGHSKPVPHVWASYNIAKHLGAVLGFAWVKVNLSNPEWRLEIADESFSELMCGYDQILKWNNTARGGPLPLYAYQVVPVSTLHPESMTWDLATQAYNIEDRIRVPVAAGGEEGEGKEDKEEEEEEEEKKLIAAVPKKTRWNLRVTKCDVGDVEIVGYTGAVESDRPGGWSITRIMGDMGATQNYERLNMEDSMRNMSHYPTIQIFIGDSLRKAPAFPLESPIFDEPEWVFNHKFRKPAGVM